MRGARGQERREVRAGTIQDLRLDPVGQLLQIGLIKTSIDNLRQKYLSIYQGTLCCYCLCHLAPLDVEKYVAQKNDAFY